MSSSQIQWIEPEDPMPPASSALLEPPGLVAAGNDLSPARVLEAYRLGVFPWYSKGQPVLWWSPDPRMVLTLKQLKISDSMAKKLRQLRRDNRWQVTTDLAFETVMRQCAEPRDGQNGTWITDRMIATYSELNQQGFAHSVEIWDQGALIGGLYGICIGRMFYGESMFSRKTDASKTALVCLADYLLKANCPMIDCQQNTAHLASMGGREIKRFSFVAQIQQLITLPQVPWAAGIWAIPDPAAVRSAVVPP
jgi:leucyl/phenylalanyl-tRNA---protein transferase